MPSAGRCSASARRRAAPRGARTRRRRRSRRRRPSRACSRRSSRARAPRCRGTRASRSAHQRAARAEERGIEEPGLEQVRDAEEAARQLGPDRRERQRRRPDQHRRRVRARAARRARGRAAILLRKNFGPKIPPATVQRPRSVTRGAASPAGNQPCTRLTRDRRAERRRRAAREEEREEHEQATSRARSPASSCRARPRSDPRAGTTSRRAPPSRCQSSACGVCSAVRATSAIETRPGHARQARREQSVVAAADHRDRVAAVVRRRGRGRQADDDRGPVRRNLGRLLDVDQHDVVRPRQARVVEDPAHHSRECGGLARARSRRSAPSGRRRLRSRAAAGRRASAPARRTTRKTCRW